MFGGPPYSGLLICFHSLEILSHSEWGVESGSLTLR